MTAPSVPDYSQLLWPTVEAVRELGGSGSIDEIVEAVLQRGHLTEGQQQVLHGDGPQTEIEYRLAWARTYLKNMKLLINSRRGVWTLTEEGRSVAKRDVSRLHSEYLSRRREERRARRQAQQVQHAP